MQCRSIIKRKIRVSCSQFSRHRIGPWWAPEGGFTPFASLVLEHAPIECHMHEGSILLMEYIYETTSHSVPRTILLTCYMLCNGSWSLLDIQLYLEIYEVIISTWSWKHIITSITEVIIYISSKANNLRSVISIDNLDNEEEFWYALR